MTTKLGVTLRDDSTTTDNLRAKGGVPAIVYGAKQEPLKVVVDGIEFQKVLREAGESTIVELTGLDSKVDTLIKDVQFHPVKKNHITHIDFYAVEAGKKITTHVPLEFIGESPAEHANVGVVNRVLHEVEVTCNPADLPNHLDVSLDSLAEVGDKIHVSDIKVPKGVTIENEADYPVVIVNEIKEEEEEETTDTVDMEAIEVEQKGKAEEDSETEAEAS